MNQIQILELVQQSPALAKNPEIKNNLESDLANLEPEKLEKIAEVLIKEKEKMAEINQRYETEIQELNEKMVIKTQELYSRTKKIIREDQEYDQAQNDAKQAEEILNSI